MGKSLKDTPDITFLIFIVACSLVVFIVTMPAGVYWKDAGEFSLGARFLGIVHPPGSPLYLLIGKLFTLLPFGAIAFRVSLISALSGAAVLVMLYIVIRYYCLQNGDAEQNRPLLTLGIIAIGSGASFWHYSSVTEVYTTAFFFFLFGVYWFERWFFEDNARHLSVSFLSLAVACSLYLPLALYIPGFLIVIVIREKWRNIPWIALLCGVSFLIGLLLLAYVHVRAGSEPLFAWRNPATLPRFFAHITGEQYRGGKLTVPVEFFPFRLFKLAMLSRYEIPVILIVMGITGFAASRRARSFMEFWIVPFWIVLVNICFSLRYSEWLPHFFLPSYLMLGFAGLVGTLHLRVRRSLLYLLVGANILYLGVNGEQRSRARLTSLPAKTAHIILDPLPQDSILILENGNSVNVCLYEQWCEGTRPDVLVLDPYGTYYSQAMHKGFGELRHIWQQIGEEGIPTFRSALVDYIARYLPQKRIFVDSVFVLNSGLYEHYSLKPVSPVIWEVASDATHVAKSFYTDKINDLEELIRDCIENKLLEPFDRYNQSLEAVVSLVNNSAEVYYQLGYTNEAIHLWELILKGTDDFYPPILNLIRAHDERGEAERAHALLDKALEKFPDIEYSHHIAGLYWLRHGQHDHAIEEFRTVLKFNPQNRQAARNLEALLKNSP